MKKILITLLLLLNLNLCVFAYDYTDLKNDTVRCEQLSQELQNYVNNKDYTNVFTTCSNFLELLFRMYNNLSACNMSNEEEIKFQIKHTIASTYYTRGCIYEMNNNHNAALKDYSESLKYNIEWAAEYLKIAYEYVTQGDYKYAESLMTVVINAPNLDNKKLSDAYKIRAQIREKLNNTYDAQQDYKKYNELKI